MLRRHLAAIAVAAALAACAGPAGALPKFARQYGVECGACHSIPPRLNTFGLAFQANYFNWPGEAPQGKGSLADLPLSGRIVYGFEENRTSRASAARFRTLELETADGLRPDSRLRGGYFLKHIAVASGGARAGNLAQAYAALPFAGRRGEWAVTLGQLSPLMFQYDPINSLTSALPAAVGLPVGLPVSRGGGGADPGPGPGPYLSAASAGSGAASGGFSFAGLSPGVRVDYFSRRGQGTADGTYAAAGAAFDGLLAFSGRSRLTGGRGLYAHAFRRRGYMSLGVIGFTRAGSHLEGLVATHALRPDLYLLAIGVVGRDDMGAARRLSAEAEYVAGPRLAFTGRIGVLGGVRNDVAPAAAVTLYPMEQPVLRLVGEVVQRKGDRRFLLTAIGQF